MVIRRIFLLFIVLITAFSSASADIAWPEETNGQKVLKQYIESVNSFLTQQGETPVNSCFDIYPGFAVLGITHSDNADVPEDVEITVKLNDDTIDSLELIVRDIPRFPAIASSFLLALFQNADSATDEISVPSQKAAQVIRDPDTSFGEEIYEDKGNAPRIYYNYIPKNYDEKSWLVMTIIFPHIDSWDGSDILTIRDEEKTYIPDEEVG